MWRLWWRLLILKFVCHSSCTGSVGWKLYLGMQALNLQELENIPDIISEKAWKFSIERGCESNVPMIQNLNFQVFLQRIFCEHFLMHFLMRSNPVAPHAPRAFQAASLD